MATKILLVDDHQIMREGLQILLNKQPDLEVIGQAGNGKDALVMISELKPDIVIMDINMPDMDGIETTKEILKKFPKTKVLALSMYLRKTFITEMFKNGAAGYLLKDNAFSDVIEAIEAISSGQKYVCPKVASLLVNEYSQDNETAASPSELTAHQREIVQMLANGQTTKEIAHLTNTSIKTVDACRRRIMKKLGIQSVAELVKFAIKEGLTTVEQ